MARHAGFKGYVKVTPSGLGIVNLFANHWSVTENFEALDITSFADPTTTAGNPSTAFGVIQKHLTGCVDVDIMIEGCWDDSQDFFGSSAPVIPVCSTAKIDLYPDILTVGSSGKLWSFATALITDCTMDVDIHGVVKYTISAKGNGTYTRV